MLGPHEYRKNFHQIDQEIIAAITSLEADQITPLMSKIYLRLVSASAQYWERDSVLRFEAEVREEKHLKSWRVLCEVLGVASAAASKALQWMHEQGIIGYIAGKNCVGIRIFLNRAASSIGVRASSGGKKILEFSPASRSDARASQNEAAFNDSFADLEVSDPDKNPRAPKDGAPEIKAVKEISQTEARETHTSNAASITEQIVKEIAPQIRAACAREHERTREWFQSHALPKAIRVSQAAAYDVLRAHGVVTEPRSRNRKNSSRIDEVGKQGNYEVDLHKLSDDEVAAYAHSCVALLITQGQTIERTLSEMSAEAGGFLLPEDAPRVRAQAEALIHESETPKVERRSSDE